MIYKATYSPEDNKLRLYYNDRLSDEDYAPVKKHGFRSAPKQECFFASWSPSREDFAVKVAGKIEPEETTLVERAAAKVERLEALAEKRKEQASSFQLAAERMQRDLSQPILSGHHSQRKAEKAKDQAERMANRAEEAADAVNYWNYKATGVEQHANYKSNPRVRKNRIKTLLKDLRDLQRRVNHSHKMVKLWTEINAIEDEEKKNKLIEYYAGAYFDVGRASPDGTRQDLRDGSITPQEALDKSLTMAENSLADTYRPRYIMHTLNRLAYEQHELGPVPRFEGELTAVIIQAFARTHGADKPKATKTDKGWLLESPVTLPLHIHNGNAIEVSSDYWKDLMQRSGYEVVIKERRAPKKQTCSLLNPSAEEAERLQAIWNADALKTKHGKTSSIKEMVQKQYSAYSGGDHSPYFTITCDQHGRRIWNSRQQKELEQVPTFKLRVTSGSGFYSANQVIVLTDKPTKPLPLEWERIEAELQESA